MDVLAKYRYLPISAHKLRLVCDQVRGMDADQALVALKFMPQKGASYVAKLIASAIANAENNFELNRQELMVATIFADEGPSQQRVKAGARGRYKPREKRTAHLTVILREYDYNKESAKNGA
jgi:large subunit ribosomal protein L22